MQFVYSHPQQQNASHTEQQCQAASPRWTFGHFQSHKQKVRSDLFTIMYNWLMFNSFSGWFVSALSTQLSPGPGHKILVWGGEEQQSLLTQPWEVLESREPEGDMAESFPEHGDYKPYKSLLLFTWGQRTLRHGSWSQQKQWCCELLHPNASFPPPPDPKAIEGEERRKQREDHKTINPDPFVALRQHSKQCPIPHLTPVPQIWGGLCHPCDSETPIPTCQH